MYEITVDRTFCAAHALMIGGRREPLHRHNWRVTATIAGGALDDDGLLCDFHAVDRVLGEVCRPFENRNLNEVAPFDETNPSAEHVARHIGLELGKRLGTVLASSARVSAVRVTEAEGCAAVFRPGGA